MLKAFVDRSSGSDRGGAELLGGQGCFGDELPLSSAESANLGAGGGLMFREILRSPLIHVQWP